MDGRRRDGAVIAREVAYLNHYHSVSFMWWIDTREDFCKGRWIEFGCGIGTSIKMEMQIAMADTRRKSGKLGRIQKFCS